MIPPRHSYRRATTPRLGVESVTLAANAECGMIANVPVNPYPLQTCLFEFHSDCKDSLFYTILTQL
jgi:hypothetical protein